MNPTSDSRVSDESVRSEAEELAAIEAEVDDSLDVLSNRSGEIRERDSSRLGSSLHSKDSSGPRRGFGHHVNLAQQRGCLSNVSARSDVYTPRSESGDTSYLAAPYSPGMIGSLRSDASSLYFAAPSDEIDLRSASDMSSERVPADKISSDSSVVMFGRLPVRSPSGNRIVFLILLAQDVGRHGGALYRMAGLLSRSEQFDSGDRGRLTRSPVTTAVVPASHLDVIPGHHLVVDFLLFRSARAHNVLKCAQTHHWTKSIWLGATVHNNQYWISTGIVTVVREFSS
uniref:Uncharacterized protein n=1 Tax=Hyaloperonospora arabidopsidis (strain Emoy2) TaxID=559515 RepID=M4BE10_HYAAE